MISRDICSILTCHDKQNVICIKATFMSRNLFYFVVERILVISKAPFSKLDSGHDIAFRSNETKWPGVMDPATSYTGSSDEVLEICGTKFRDKYHRKAASRLICRKINPKVIHRCQNRQFPRAILERVSRTLRRYGKRFTRNRVLRRTTGYP